MAHLRMKEIKRAWIAVLLALCAVKSFAACIQIQCQTYVGLPCNQMQEYCAEQLKQSIARNACRDGVGGQYSSNSICGSYQGYCGSEVGEFTYSGSSVYGTLTICTEPLSSSSSAQSSSSSGGGGAPPLKCNMCQNYNETTFPFKSMSRVLACDSCPQDGNGFASAYLCEVVSEQEGSCEENDECPEGQICMQDSTQSPVDCYATVGPTVYLRNRNNGHVWGCDADGDCQTAQRKYMSGECQDPNPSPDDGSSSSGDEPNSSSGAESSASQSSGSQDGPWGREETLKLVAAYGERIAENSSDIANYTQETMNKTIDISNQLTEMGIDVSHIRTNTEATATNTGNIDNKLTITNSLLTDIKNKNWQPTINVGSPEVNIGGDTIIIQGDTNIVNVETDTAHAPAEILGFLRNLFSGLDSNGWNGDTTGWGAQNDSMALALDSANSAGNWLTAFGCDTTGGRKCDGSIIGVYGLDSATARTRAMYRAIGDTLRNGAFGDSLQNWASKFTGGTITGSGSNSCPTVLTKVYHVRILGSAGYTFTLGRYLCQPIFGNTTAWTLCRVLLRATVALACMWFLFKCAVGFGGKGDDE